MNREAFEKWAATEFDNIRRDGSSYESMMVAGAYIGWQAAQAQAPDPVAVADKGVINWIDGKQFDHEADLYTQPAVNQQLLEGYVLTPTEPTEAMIDAGVAVAFAASVHGKGGWNNYMNALYRAFIAAAQEQKV